MARIKKEKVIEIVEEAVVNTPVEASTKPVVTFETKSRAYLSFQAHIEQYAKQNPAKYNLKKETLLSKLNTL